MSAAKTSPIVARPSLRVLIIDDSPISRALVSNVLQGRGYAVFELASPIGATRMVANHQVDVILIDVQMPSMTGDRLAALFRRNPRFNRVRIVLISDCLEESLRRLARTVGANAVVCKQNLERDLASTVEKLATAV